MFSRHQPPVKADAKRHTDGESHSCPGGNWESVIDQNQNRADHDGDSNGPPQIFFPDPHRRPLVFAQQ